MFHGSMVALVTPMQHDHIDITALQELVEWQIVSGTQAIIAAGTTGESGTLSSDEKKQIITAVVEQAQERVPIIAGTNAQSTKEAIVLTEQAMHCGAHGALIMTPAYIKPTQEGLYRHYATIAQAVPIPIILYNVPQRTSCDLLPETVQRLAKISNIVAIKDATGDLQRLMALQQLCADEIDIFSGDDASALTWLLSGAKGVISVTANVLPQILRNACDLALSGNKSAAEEWQQRLSAINKLLFAESNPIPVKWALYQLGRIRDELRMPLTSLSEDYQEPLRAALAAIN